MIGTIVFSLYAFVNSLQPHFYILAFISTIMHSSSILYTGSYLMMIYMLIVISILIAIIVVEFTP